MGIFRSYSSMVASQHPDLTNGAMEDIMRNAVVGDACNSGFTPTGQAYAVWGRGGKVYGEVEVAERTDGR